MTLPIKYRKSSGEPSLNYNFTDVASGIGYVILDGFATQINDAADTDYFSIPAGSNITSFPRSTASSATSSTTFLKVLDVDFDVSVAQYTTVINGVAFVQVSWISADAFGTGDSTECYIEWNVIHVAKDATETLLGTVRGDTYGESGGSRTVRTETLHTSIAKTTIKPGEFLRMNMAGYARETGAGGGALDAQLLLIHDPKNSDITVFSITVTAANNHTDLKFHLPFSVKF